MQCTFTLNTEELDEDFIEALKLLFRGEHIEIIVEPIDEIGKENLPEGIRESEDIVES